MCGICGYTGSNNRYLDLMIRYIRRRGPDYEGEFSKNNIHLGATRLSIRDIKNGNQPFLHSDINFVTVFNGEIYNYHFLKKKIQEKGYIFKTNCDTELIAPGFKFYGINFFSLIEGMFAFAIHDLSNGKLTIGRDRFGIKPLYYSVHQNNLFFSSCAKSIYNLDFFKKKLSAESLESILSRRYVDGLKHIFHNINQLKPGEILNFHNQKIKKVNFITDEEKIKKLEDKNELIQIMDNFFKSKINGFKLSDVDLGIMLSSGVDSSLINEKLKDSIKHIFTLDFGNSKFDESNRVKNDNSNHIDQLNVCRFDENAFQEIFDDTIDSFDNPITDSVIFPTSYLMKNVSKKVKVAFSGEGADEIFGGYYYFNILNYSNFFNKFSLGKTLSNILQILPHNILNIFFNYQGKLGIEGKKRLIESLNSNFKFNEDFEDLISVFSTRDQENLVNSDYHYKKSIKKNFSRKNLFLDNFNNWLPNYTLYKTDQLSMYNGLEVRVPYLNNDFYDIFLKIINYKNSSLYNNKKVLLEYVRNRSKIKINKKIALQNYLDGNNKTFFSNIIEDKLKKNSIIFDLIHYSNFLEIKKKYNLKPELILEKKLSSLVILNSWLEKNV